MAAPAVKAEDEFMGEHHVYTPHRAGPPPLRPYVRELWRRRQFVDELARSTLRSQNYATVFGMVWLILSPLLNALVYYLLVDILSSSNRPPEFLPHLLGGIFAWTFVSGCIASSATSVTGGGRLILNTAFPRLLLPVTQIVVALFRFLPTIPILAVAVAVTVRGNVGPGTLMAVPAFALIVVTASGLGFLAAVLQVYFRDFRNLLPYLLRLGLYLTPILYFASDAKGGKAIITKVNPLAPVFTAWSDATVRGEVAPAGTWALATAYALVLFVAGTLFYASREREFAVRL